MLQTSFGVRDGSVYIHDIELRTSGRPENLESAVRKTLAGIDPNLTILGMTSLAEQVSLNFNQDRLIARLTELFGLVALVTSLAPIRRLVTPKFLSGTA